jgi:hypothetical protein
MARGGFGLGFGTYCLTFLTKKSITNVYTHINKLVHLVNNVY